MSASGERQPDPDGGPAPAVEGEPTGGAAAPAPEEVAPEAPVCDVCGSPMYERHCRILCPRCGYQRDCSDP